LKQEGLEYPVVRLTTKADEVLRGNEPVMLSVLVSVAEKVKKEKAPARERLADVAYDQDIFEELRRVRRQLADRENVPAYIILSDKSLVELAARKPRTLAQLEDIYGFGKVKLEKYGTTFLEALKNF
jgi:ATP-dependent DNA helicase RecQ